MRRSKRRAREVDEEDFSCLERDDTLGEEEFDPSEHDVAMGDVHGRPAKRRRSARNASRGRPAERRKDGEGEGKFSGVRPSRELTITLATQTNTIWTLATAGKSSR